MGTKRVKMVTCPMGNKEADSAFVSEHTYLYHSICRLADRVAAYHLCGDSTMLIAERASREGVPRFVSATFDAYEDARYERDIERRLQKRHFMQFMPKPPFSVTLETEFADGGCETFVFDFSEYTDEAIAAFCECVGTVARYRFRHRFSRKNASKNDMQDMGGGD